ncbi:PRTRC system protein B [Chitinophaga sp. YIM B06452]|uniref:PRTRC system protein B n=1 Tax=Chitinophaga sp. YIM B06452 TaxID=3082158 RepID=UPI0031FE54DA
MKEITQAFKNIFAPACAMVIYQSRTHAPELYVETYDFNDHGRPVNARPLSVDEASRLSRMLDVKYALQRGFLCPEGLLPENVLYLSPIGEGMVIWYTPPQEVNLLFIEKLGIPNGKAYVPGLIWKATPKALQVFAFLGKDKPQAKTPLYHAPFFNLYNNGSVCMGTVEPEGFAPTLNRFMAGWEQTFWRSYFSHVNGSASPVKGNIVQLWKKLVGSGTPFPEGSLKSMGKTLFNILT